MAEKPSIPKGTRDFGPVETGRRNYIFNTIQSVFEKYGYQPIETPAVENLNTLLGKYGEEGDRLIFKILNSGDYLARADEEALSKKDSGRLTGSISEKALRYDLTVPFARFVVQHQNDITFPFKRYQIQPVWRADRPQKGRYREFYQCDVDVIGSGSLLNEVELVQIIDEVFRKLNVGVRIKLNNRKILTGLAEVVGAADKIIDITVAIDKLEKIGMEKVNAEMLEKGVPQAAVDKLQPLMVIEGDTTSKLSTLKEMLTGSEIGLQGITELESIFSVVNAHASGVNMELDITLARGLNYYTGAIFEVVTNDFPGSICGGGRYDDLTGIFGLPDVSGVGVSFGADRIYDVLLERDLFPASAETGPTLMVARFNEEYDAQCLALATAARQAGIATVLYPDAAKPAKQFKYANNMQFAYVAVIAEVEAEKGVITLKDMESGEQQELTQEQLIERLQ